MPAVAAQFRPSQKGVGRLDLTLVAKHVASIATVRHRLADVLESRGFTAALVDTALLLTTELLSNAFLHTATNGCPVTVRLDVQCSAHQVVIAVTDADPRLPVAGSANAEAEGGRGLALVSALATRWGTRNVPAGKTVWCLLTPTATPVPDTQKAADA